MASSKPATTLMLMMGAKYSSNQSCSVAAVRWGAEGWPSAPAGAVGCDFKTSSVRGSQRISTPLAANTAAIWGRNSLATPAATNRLSQALQGLYFWVLALSTTRRAMARSQGSSTYTWQLPSRCLMTGTLASRLMRSINDLPPRGMMRSTNSGMAMSWPTNARSVLGTSCTASAGKPLSAKDCRTSSASALLEAMASDPPRRMQALPLLMDKLAASMVTLGRLS